MKKKLKKFCNSLRAVFDVFPERDSFLIAYAVPALIGGIIGAIGSYLGLKPLYNTILIIATIILSSKLLRKKFGI